MLLLACKLSNRLKMQEVSPKLKNSLNEGGRLH
jgi:hypothetical protein